MALQSYETYVEYASYQAIIFKKKGVAVMNPHTPEKLRL